MQINAEREKLLELEKKHYEMEKLLETCEQGQDEQLHDNLHKDQELLDSQRRVFDDLEFQQLEVWFSHLHFMHF